MDEAGADLLTDSVSTLLDEPALADNLELRSFAQILALRIREIKARPVTSRRGDNAAFILHLDGGWGQGKSAILNFIRDDLEHSDPPWMVVHFNAWHNRRRKLGWWSLITEVGSEVRRKWYRLPIAWLIWTGWRWRMRWLPIVLAASLIVLVALLAVAVASSNEGASGVAKALADAAAGLLALIAVAAFGMTAGRKLLFGSESSVDSYLKSSAAPFEPVTKMFRRMIVAIRPPVAVLIDDLDNCESDFVVDLLNDIQTLLRSAPVVYVVAADRRWIASSFEKIHGSGRSEPGLAGTRLGYLFLDSIFQLSVSIPRPSVIQRKDYWNRLVQPSSGAGNEGEQPEVAPPAHGRLSCMARIEDLQDAVVEAADRGVRHDLLRAAAAREIVSAEKHAVAAHRIRSLIPLLNPNPGSLRRFLDSYSLNRARAVLEGRIVAPEALARWTLIEMQWPILAEYVAANWPDIADVKLSRETFPSAIRELLLDPDVRAVIGDEGEAGRLTIEALDPILAR